MSLDRTKEEGVRSLTDPCQVRYPAPESDLVLAGPIDRWDEALPLGNGLMGGLVWGSGKCLKISLDRGDLWDLRVPETLQRKDWTFQTIERLVAAKDQKTISELFDAPYSDVPYATKIPAGRLEIEFPSGETARIFSLDLMKALGIVTLNQDDVQVFFSAEEPVAMLRTAQTIQSCRLVPPASVSKLGYPGAQTGQDGEASWFVQEASLGLRFAVVCQSRQGTHGTEMALAVVSSSDGEDPLALGLARTKAALDKGFDSLFKEHVRWWNAFWGSSSVRLPDPGIQQQYDLVQYFYGAASRKGAPPIPLQGVWTADEGGLPPWHGDYHHDLNTQLTYWAYLASGRFEEGESFLEFMWNLLPQHREFARTFYGTPGAAVPGVMTLDGKPMGGWSQYSLSPTDGAWVAQSFYLHWRYTQNSTFLRTRAYPYCAEIGTCLKALMKPDSQGKLKLPLSTSPEIHNNQLDSWLTPNSNFDLALMRWLFGALQEMATELNDSEAARAWGDVLAHLDPLAVEEDSLCLRLSPTESLRESHRHLSHLMALHPLGTLSIEGSERDRQVISASLDHLKSLGTGAWCGYSFSWMACMAARCDRPEDALQNLTAFVRAFVSRNGFHLNGDYKRLGYANGDYRPFTLEGNFAAGQAVHEMLLQGWGQRLRIFPAVPEQWTEVSFDGLWAEGGFRVWADRREGRTVWVKIEATQDQSLRLKDPFQGQGQGRKIRFNRKPDQQEGEDRLWRLRAGEVVEARCDPEQDGI